LATRGARGTRGANASLQQSVDRLAEAFESLADRIDALEVGGNGAGGEADRFTSFVQRWMPFFALGAIFLLMFLVLPSRSDDDREEAGQVTSSDTSTGLTPGTEVAGETETRTDSNGSGPAATSGATPPPPTANVPAGFDPLAWNLTGQTAGGYECKAGVRQIPWSSYAAPCYPKWTEGNPGATSHGVTEKEITIVIRRFPETANSRAVEAAQVAAGFASTDVARAVGDKWRDWFNKVFELWGRKVKWVIYESQFGNATDEAQSKGKEGACADANVIKNDIKAFAVLGTTGGSNVFAECAAERKMVLFWGGAYFPERWYKKLHPYVWHTTMECERISYQVAEYIGKRLANKPAKWAKNLQKDKKRVFATYVPNNPEYQYCVGITEKTVREKYNQPNGPRYDYTLDISRFADEAANAAISFNAAGATTLIMACDPISMVFLTQSAKAQNWWPEWFNIGVALNDSDNFPRTWDAEEIRGSLFGMSQIGATKKVLGKDSESGKSYKAATGTNIPEGTTGEPFYMNFLTAFNAMQAAGPNLTPQTLADAFWRLPPAGAPDFPAGYISYQDGPDGTKGAKDHAGIDDSREIWWNADGTGADGEQGTYVETYGGKRFRNGEWPSGDPPIFK
jgi:hypothetical protein